MSNKKKTHLFPIAKDDATLWNFLVKTCGVNKNVIFVKENTFDKELEFEWPGQLATAEGIGGFA